MFFAVVTGSGSGKLCWHSRGNDNDQENAGYVRESAGGSEQVLRAEEVQKRSFCRRSFPHFFRCWKKWGRRRQRNACAGARLHLIRHGFAVPPVSLRVGRSAGLTRHRRVIQHREPLEGKA